MSRRTGRDERGAVLVEFALILPVLVLILFGIVEYGLAFNNLNNLRQGTREGARQGVVALTDGDSSCAVTGIAPNTATRELICLVKDRVGLDPAKVRVKIAFPGGNEDGESLLVCTQYPLDSITGIFSTLLDGKVMTTEVRMRIEQIDESYQAVAETPLPSSSWGWCS